MRKLNIFSAVLSLFLLVPASIIWAQTISTQKGLTTIVFNIQPGTIKIYLPDDIRPGDVISGTIVTEPAGNNSRQTGRNLSELKRFVLSIDGNRIIIPEDKETFKWVIPENRQLLSPVELLSPTGLREGQAELPFNKSAKQEQTKKGCSSPSHILTAAPVRIRGTFDGDLSNTQCRLDTESIQVLAESPRQCLVTYPRSGQGLHTLRIAENGIEKCTSPVSGVDMQVTAGPLALKRGQGTYIEIKITGLQGLPERATLTVTNMTPDVVTMTNGNVQVISVFDDPDDMDGVFAIHCPAIAMTGGNFQVTVNLDLPEKGSPVFADVKKGVGGKREESVLTAGTRTSLELGMKKWADANTEGKYPIDYDCPSCFQCIKTVTTESNVAQVGGLGWGIITSFLSGAVSFAGGILSKVKDIADKGGDIYKAIQELIDAGQIQVVGFEDKWCPASEYCKVTGVIVYDVLNGCVEAVYKCTGTKMCCPFAETYYTIKYCLDKDGAVIAETVSMSISH